MSETTCHMSVSLDGFVAGPDQSLENPLGRRGLEVHHWHLDEPLHDADAQARELLMRPRGAYVMGRNMFGPVRGDWGDSDWRGWWGPEPPYHHPVFVLTHHPHDPIEMDGGTTFHFVTDGIESALRRAREAAGEADVTVNGGASAIQQYLAAGLLDELEISIAPLLLGGGERLLDNLGDEKIGLEQVRAVEGVGVTHITYRVANG